MIFAGRQSVGFYYSQALTVSGPKDDFDRFFDMFFTKDDHGQPTGIAIDRVAPAPGDIRPEEVWNDDDVIDLRPFTIVLRVICKRWMGMPGTRAARLLIHSS